MMDEAIKTHKETSFGWVLALQHLAAAFRRARTSRRMAGAAESAVQNPTPPKPMRYLAPR